MSAESRKLGKRGYARMGIGLRGSGYEFTDLINQATSRFVLVGQNLYALLQDGAHERTKERIWDFLRRSPSVKGRCHILFCDREAGDAVRTWTAVTADPYGTHLEHATKILESWQTEADGDPNIRGRLDIRRTFFVPLSATIVDDSYIVLVPNAYTAIPSNRPWFLITQKDNPIAFEAYRSQYENRLSYPYSVEVTSRRTLLKEGYYGWPPELGERFAHYYRLKERLDAGQQGEVHLALDREGREVALKLIKGTPNKVAMERLRREVAALRALDHPGIAKLYDVLDDGGNFKGFSQEFVRGKNLRRHLKEGRKFSEREVIELMLKVTDAVAHIHRKDIVHRDIKPENIMVLNDGVRVKVLDFGQALFPMMDCITSGTHDVGTFEYMAPEQKDDPHGVDARCDVYSLGVVTLELVTESRNPKRVSGLSHGLRGVVSKCLEEDPEKRYENAQALWTALNGLRGA